VNPTYELICGDAIEVMRKHDFPHIAAVITDPPFAVSNSRNESNEWNGYTSNKGSWDGKVDSIWVDEACKLLLPGGIFAVFGTFGSLVPIYLRLQERDMTFQSHIIWHKANPAPCVHRRMLTHANEIILVYSKGPKWTFNYEVAKSLNGGKQLHNVWDAAVAKRIMGRTVKPVSILDKLTLCFTNPGDWVLDPFCGTSSIGKNALIHSRNYIGIDNDQTVLDTFDPASLSIL
jgi:site-specific DNA-methyltransferase (adenine-specific)